MKIQSTGKRIARRRSDLVNGRNRISLSFNHVFWQSLYAKIGGPANERAKTVSVETQIARSKTKLILVLIESM
mgnify:CR=1 FL=1